MLMSEERLVQIQRAVADQKLQRAVYSATARLKEKRVEVVAEDQLPEYQELREQARLIKKHALENLDYYLEQFEANVIAHGGKVIWARNGDEAADFILETARRTGANMIVKSKSMVTEEIHLNDRLEKHGLETVETDLGEYIQQLAHEPPFHIIAPACHKTRQDIAEIFRKSLNVECGDEPESQAALARRTLREKFLAAGIGISGANFLVADSGAITIVENEGNARLCTTAPRVHIAVTGIEKIIPRAQDLAVFLKLLARSATGQLLTVYTSFLSGPRRTGETDGPDEFYVVLMDNGRTKLLADREKRESLHCIRCGACLNACPVYRKIGGHNYPSTYSGPIGAIITPQYQGVMSNPWLPFASSLCGACAEVCPVKIDIPKILLDLRREVVAEKTKSGGGLERLAFRGYSWLMQRPRLYALAGRLAAIGAHLPFTTSIGPAAKWASQREVPMPASESFRSQWRKRKGAK
ncbi:MAG: LutB/LldF family L-lactate oxidation iron-sulfur protein [Bryobacteraceae bacterium]|nr:LutB/LldF family L-lactate oxidation iron-sulfur protein [Bryobacteraceae bacterium]